MVAVLLPVSKFASWLAACACRLSRLPPIPFDGQASSLTVERNAETQCPGLLWKPYRWAALAPSTLEDCVLTESIFDMPIDTSR